MLVIYFNVLFLIVCELITLHSSIGLATNSAMGSNETELSATFLTCLEIDVFHSESCDVELSAYVNIV